MCHCWSGLSRAFALALSAVLVVVLVDVEVNLSRDQGGERTRERERRGVVCTPSWRPAYLGADCQMQSADKSSKHGVESPYP